MAIASEAKEWLKRKWRVIGINRSTCIIVELIQEYLERVHTVGTIEKPTTTTVTSIRRYGAKLRKRSFLEKVEYTVLYGSACSNGTPLVRVFLARTLNTVFRHVIREEFSRSLCQ